MMFIPDRIHKKISPERFLFFIFFVFCLVYSPRYLSAQSINDKDVFRSPVDIDILLSGNFAELRGSHFHTGIDIKTQGKTGLNIYAIADGYVSRIKVSPYGYGNALYITHPNGYTSVYAHLHRFNIQIEEYVRRQQYASKSFAVNLFPEPGLINVKQGEVVGKGGNSGSSLGPHLHFEIRTTDNEKPQNPLRWNFDVVDNIIPRFHNLIVYPLSDGATVNNVQRKLLFSLQKSGNNYKVKNNAPIKVADTIGLGVYVNDYLNNTYNRCGVNQLKVFVDDVLTYFLELNELSFAENRYILSHMDYALKVDRNIKAHKCFIDEGNHFSGYKFSEERGKVFVAPGDRKHVEVHAIDAHGNKSVLSFTLLGVDPVKAKQNITVASVLKPGQTNHFENEDVHLVFPSKSLYTKLNFTYSSEPGSEEMYSKIYQLHDKHVPLHQRFNFILETPDVPNHLKNKLYLASVAQNGNTSPVTSKVRCDKGRAHTRIRSFGRFALMADTIAPEIRPVNIYENKDMTSEQGISVKITDDATGIESYNGYINGIWVLFSYDAKNDLLYYEFDEYLPQDSTLQLKLIVSDPKHNTSIKTINFKRSEEQTNL
ncbi:putative peptidase [Salinivirga cyanobacteriivorans]|uniref:Putative peptidase n=1 Tax=Salinivirga cyanobacteriivorans TaxID=1307839 RepID=A0A0S2HYQ0_9BACT|nr:putative peptidase [Salinivirga cyanobacteriivorans]